MEFLNAFWIGGLICVIGQLLIDLTKLTPARIMVLFVSVGILLGALNLYDPIIDFAGSGASVPLSGFGNLLAKGVKSAVEDNGILGIFTGGVSAAAAGISSASFFGILAALLSRPNDKS